MRSVVVILSVIFLFGCKKRNDGVNPLEPVDTLSKLMLKDFKFFPRKDATWRIWFQGSYDSTILDTNYNFYYTVTCAGEDTSINNATYYKYPVEIEGSYKLNSINLPSRATVYLREDTVDNKSFVILRWANITYPDRLLVDYDRKIGDTLPYGFFPYGSIISRDSLLVDSQYLYILKAKNFDNNPPYFYQGYGIGSKFGPLPFAIVGNGSKIRQLKFIYKSDSVVFTYPLSLL